MRRTILVWVMIGAILAQFCFAADPLDFWICRNPYPTGNSLNRIIYADGQFVGVGAAGAIVRSPDGVKWTDQNSSTSDNLSDVVWGSGIFVAVGGNSSSVNCTVTSSHCTILTSADGVTWTQRVSPTTNVLTHIAYGNGTYVAVGGNYCSGWGIYQGYYGSSNTIVMVSSDGTNWKEDSVGTQAFVPGGITFGNGYFVTVGSLWPSSSEEDGVSFISTDGVNWTEHNLGTNSPNSFSAIAYANGEFVAIGSSYNSTTETTTESILASPDGITWTAVYSTVNGNSGGDSLNAINFANGQFTIVDAGYSYVWYGPYWYYWNVILTSTDGTNWSSSRIDGMTPWHYINTLSYSSGKFVAAAGDQIFTSPDAQSWTQQSYDVTASDSLNLAAVTFGQNQFVAVGQRYDSVAQKNIACVLTSPRGMNWTEHPTDTNSYPLSCVTFGNGQYIAGGGKAQL